MAPTNMVTLDSRKFLGAINDSAQARVAFFEDRIKEMGQRAGKKWQLAALRANELYFEDADHQYFVADHSKDGRKVTITNIRPINIVEEEKQELFDESCYKLVEAIETNDQREMHAAFNRMKAQRFSGRAIPYSGYVRCHDHILRKVNVESKEGIGDNSRTALIKAIVEGLRDNVIVENGRVVSGVFNDGNEIKLPVTKWAARKLVARRMAEAAKDAYWSQGFQKRIRHIANLVAEGKIEEAVKIVSPFLNEMEEFTLLTRQQTQTLVENALAAGAMFNQQLCTDTATLFHRTNLKINKAKIVDEWRNIARKAEHPVLAENVQILSESNNFESAYDKFLKLIFEAISNREVAAEALATTLEVLRTKTPKIRESHDLSSKLENLISRLKVADFDDAAIYEAEDLIATIQEELAATETLGNFDQIPGTGMGAGNSLDPSQPNDPLSGAAAAGGGAAGGVPPIVINSPLIQIGGSSGGAGGGAEPPPPDDMGMPPEPGMEDPNADPNAAPGGAPGAPGAPAPGGGGTDELEALLGGGGLGEGLESGDALMENDPYAIKPNEFELVESTVVSEYGAPVITDNGDMRRILNLMHRLASEHKLVGKALSENLENMARAGIKAIGLRVPTGRLNHAVEQIVSLFESEKPFPGAAAPFGKKGGKGEKSEKGKGGGKPWENDGDEDDEGVAEDQYHPPRIPPRGLKKASITKSKRTQNEGIMWKRQTADAMLGEYAGVNFIFDHGGSDDNLKPVLLSEDGAIEVPIPEHLYNSAFAAAEMTDDDPNPFVEWLNGSIESVRPITDDEDRALEEAMAKITTDAQGNINVEVTNDVEVGAAEEGGMGMEGGMEGDPNADPNAIAGAMGDLEPEEGMGGEEEAGAGMAPVDSLDTAGAEGGMEPAGEEAMPDFEAQDEMGGAEPAAEPAAAGAPPAGAAPAKPAAPAMKKPAAFEDKDITDPQSSKYTKHVKENPRAMPAHKMTGKTDDKLDEIGPELKKDDGTGTNSPTAKS